mmetsp:Transcript_68658/g.200945  ORF Transcript_68658/g.200945 Transcript_68658/m.200945 type:complete len:206 (+) Transcript_68658:752-1369(+)
MAHEGEVVGVRDSFLSLHYLLLHPLLKLKDHVDLFLPSTTSELPHEAVIDDPESVYLILHAPDNLHVGVADAEELQEVLAVNGQVLRRPLLAGQNNIVQDSIARGAYPNKDCLINAKLLLQVFLRLCRLPPHEVHMSDNNVQDVQELHKHLRVLAHSINCVVNALLRLDNQQDQGDGVEVQRMGDPNIVLQLALHCIAPWRVDEL